MPPSPKKHPWGHPHPPQAALGDCAANELHTRLRLCGALCASRLPSAVAAPPSRCHPGPTPTLLVTPAPEDSSCGVRTVADWYAENKFYSPYYTESHVEFAAKVRAFVDAEIRPNVLKWYAPRSLLLTHDDSDDDTWPV